MRRVYLFLAVLVASLVALTVVVAVGLALFASSPWNWYGMGGMMGGNGGMMGGNGGAVQNPVGSYFWVAFIVLVGVVVVGVVGLAYYVAVPEIRAGVAPVVCEAVPKEHVVQANAIVEEPRVEQKSEAVCTPLESIVKTLSEDERKVVDVLAAHDGKYLQKYIRNEVGLSRLQTHRVVARLAERGIVTLEKTGNTNTVLIADWLKK
jgi:predicted transcriptional regulator